MEKGISYLKENWLLVLICLLFLGWVVSMLNEPYGLLILAVTVVFGITFQFLSKKIFKLHKKGPIPWYGSPIIWLGVLIFCVLVFWYVRHT